MADPIQESARFIDLSTRLVQSSVVVASPAAATETIIASLVVPSNLSLATGVFLFGYAAFTVGTNGVSVQLRLRRTNAAGTIKGDSGAVTATATNLGASYVGGFDSTPTDPQTYVLTATVASGSAPSTVSAVQLVAIAV